MRKDHLMTPGPTPLPPEVSSALGRLIIHHRTPRYRELFKQAQQGLQQVFQTANPVLVFTASGTGAMEAAVVNLCSPGDVAIVTQAGKFGERWGKLCKTFGIEPVIVEAPYGQAVDPAAVKAALAKHAGAKAVFTTLCVTPTGVVHDVQAIARIAREANALSVVDAISGLGADELPADAWGIDVIVSGSQKGLMLPPGLAFASVSERAWQAVAKAASKRYYFDFSGYRKALADDDTPFTPAVSIVIALIEALRLLREEGLTNVITRHRQLAEATRAAMSALGLELFAARPSNAVTSVVVPAGVDGKLLVKRLRDVYGIGLAGGQGEMEGKIFRFAHLGYITLTDVLMAVSTVEMALSELGHRVALGRGVAAAQESFLKTLPPITAATPSPAVAGKAR